MMYLNMNDGNIIPFNPKKHDIELTDNKKKIVYVIDNQFDSYKVTNNDDGTATYEYCTTFKVVGFINNMLKKRKGRL